MPHVEHYWELERELKAILAKNNGMVSPEEEYLRSIMDKVWYNDLTIAERDQLRGRVSANRLAVKPDSIHIHNETGGEVKVVAVSMDFVASCQHIYFIDVKKPDTTLTLGDDEFRANFSEKLP